MNEQLAESPSGQRGPAEHKVREQIVSAANDHFRHYGYGKTTLADLAKAIGFSKAYIYKFFDSKQSIGELICGQCLTAISEEVADEVSKGRNAVDKLRRMFKTIVVTSANLLFEDRRLYDIAAHSSAEKWHSYIAYTETLYAQLESVILEGREAGEFERKTPLDETCRAILQVMQPFIDPRMLQYNLDLVPDGPNEVTSLVLRSLAP